MMSKPRSNRRQNGKPNNGKDHQDNAQQNKQGGRTPQAKTRSSSTPLDETVKKFHEDAIRRDPTFLKRNLFSLDNYLTRTHGTLADAVTRGKDPKEIHPSMYQIYQESSATPRGQLSTRSGSSTADTQQTMSEAEQTQRYKQAERREKIESTLRVMYT